MIEVGNLSKKFEDHTIFSGLNLTFDARKCYALIGKSGSGKTNLLNILAKLEPFTQGEVTYQGKPIVEIKSHEFFLRHLGYLFQNYGLLKGQSIAENLDLGLLNDKTAKKN